MSVVSEQFREAVVKRADNHCEYCQLPAQLQIGGFEIDHIFPRSRGGQTELSNVALACLHCNARKWAHVDGEDPESGQRVTLFNPRTQTWEEHFRWSEQLPFALMGVSVRGRATVARLQMNHPDLMNIRRLLAELGLSWRADTSGQ
ncbi:MAG: HNH endonuclease [Candidatus Binatia bacterium]